MKHDDQWKPTASAANTIRCGRARFQWLTARMVRMEWSAGGAFEDRSTLTVVNRRLPDVEFRVERAADRYVVTSSHLRIDYRDDGHAFSPENLSVSLTLNGKAVVWTPGLKPEGNLGSTLRTLDAVDGNRFSRKIANPDYIANGQGKGKTGKPGQSVTEFVTVGETVDLGQGLLSRDGWAVVDDSRSVVLDKQKGREWVFPRNDRNGCDLYFLGYGHDYKDALADAARVFGRQPLPPRYAFGYWWSRYWAYTDAEIEELVERFDTMKIPIDVMVIDMDWHLEGWTGYTWDRRYFPDPDEFLGEMKRRGVKVTLNLHPADGVGRHEEQFAVMAKAMGLDPKQAKKVEFDITDPTYMANYFKHLHHPAERRGIEFWWMDWQQGATTRLPGLDTLPWINHLHWHDMARNPQRGGKRPLILSRFGGLGAGRYCVGFSGDTYSNWDSLAFQPYFTATAANVLYGYWSHDIGGHMPGDIEPELFTRWMQFGLFSPVLRTHTTKYPTAERRTWEYPAPHNRIMADTIRRRYELTPYIYSECRKTYDQAVSLCRPMYYDYPEAEEAYRAKNQYLFGDHMLVAPILNRGDTLTEMAEVSVWLPEGPWFDTARGAFVEGGRLFTGHYLIDEIPVFVRPGTVIPGQRGVTRLNGKSIEDLVISIYGGDSGQYDLYEDDGISSAYESGRFARMLLSHRIERGARSVELGPVRGGYDGFLPVKAIELRIAGDAPPKSVRVAGRPIPFSFREKPDSWRFDAKSAMTIIRLAPRDITAGLSIRIALQDAKTRRLADGLPGLFNRMARVNYFNTFATSTRVLHKDERVGVKIAQTGNRIARSPANFAAEIHAARGDLATLKAMLRELSVAKSDNPFDGDAAGSARRRSYCEKALAILQTL